VARLGNGMMDSLPSGFPIQSLGEWVRWPQDSLAGWTRQVIDQALHALEESPELEQVYTPGVAGISKSRGNLQYFRWAPSIQGLPDGRYLARGGSVGRVGGYQVIEVQRRKVVAARSVDFSGGDPRRLLYGLDAAAGWPTHVGVTRRGDDVIFRLENELPKAEHRLFTALGRLTLPPDGRYYPRRWTVPVALAPEARAALQRLGITLDEDVEVEG
jgi:hypothetical protein